MHASEREQFRRRLIVAFTSYLLALLPTYWFIRWVYPYSERFAFWSVAIAVTITLPVMAYRAYHRYKKLSGADPQ